MTQQRLLRVAKRSFVKKAAMLCEGGVESLISEWSVG